MVMAIAASIITNPAAAYAQEMDSERYRGGVYENIKELSPEIIVPQGITGLAGQKLSEITLPEGWRWAESDKELTEEQMEYTARYAVDEESYDYSQTEGYFEEGHYVERTVPISVSNKTNSVKNNQLSLFSDTEDVTEAFEDPAFKAYMLANYGSGGKLLKGRLAGIDKLTIPNNTGIKSLKGIEWLTKLKTLMAQNNPTLTTIDVSKNTELTYLSCSGKLRDPQKPNAPDISGVTSIILNNPELKTISAFNAKLSTLSNLDNTKVQGVDFRKNSKLTQAYCENTPLAWLDVGDAATIPYFTMPSTSAISLKPSSRTFDIREVFNGIDPKKITIVSNGLINDNTGIVSDYTMGTPMVYKYDCGINNNIPQELTVTLNLLKEDTKIEITCDSSIEYTGD